MKLSRDRESLVLDNLRLVHHLVKKWGLTPKDAEYEDYVSSGTIGLVKAACTFSETKKIKFATYASRCITNELGMYYRKRKQQARDGHLDEPITNDRNGNEIKIIDTIEDPDSDFVEKMINKEDFILGVSIVLNYLAGKERLVILYTMGHVSQRNIANIINISQCYVSKIAKKASSQIRRAWNKQVKFEEVYSFEYIGEEYSISFSSKEITNLNQICSKVSTEKGLTKFKLESNKERIILQVPADLESFVFIAKIIQEIDAFSKN